MLDGWGAAVDGEDAIAAVPVEGLSELVWATSFDEVLHKRRAARMKEVAERKERMEETGSEADALRAALRKEEGEGEEEEEETEAWTEEPEDEEDDDGPRVIEID